MEVRRCGVCKLQKPDKISYLAVHTGTPKDGRAVPVGLVFVEKFMCTGDRMFHICRMYICMYVLQV